MRCLALLLAWLLALPTATWAATATSTCTVGTGWATTPGNAAQGSNQTPDGALASTAVTGQPLLSITTCGLTSSVIPAGSTINGVQVRTVGCGSGTTGQRAINVNLLGVGTCTAKTGLSQGACGTMTDQTSGTTSDTWSCTALTLANVNATTFGASVQTNTSNSATNSI